jgi:hypothetical protein
MAALHKFLLASLVFSLSPASTFTQEPQNNTSTAQLCARASEDMTPQELQIIANITYLLYANAFIDSKIQETYSPLARLSQKIRINMTDVTNPNNELTTLHLLIEKLSYLTKARTVYTDMLNTCFNYYNQHKTDAIEATLKALQLHAQDYLRAWADENNQEFIEYLQESTATMTQVAEYIQSTSNIHTKIVAGILPFEIEEESSKSIAILHAVTKSAPFSISAADAIINALDETVDQAMKIIYKGTEIYKEYYQEFYNIIATGDKQYATVLFGRERLLPKKSRPLLPSTNQLIEHMRTTAEQYMQETVV